MEITATHINYFMVCHRKLWLFANQINMEHTSELVEEGKLIHETTYPQRSSKYKEIAIGGIKIDFYDPKNKVIHEVKKSNKVEDAHVWQLKYYMYVLEQCGLEGVTGILEYPKLRKTDEVLLSERDRTEIEEFKTEIETILNSDTCPRLNEKKICKKCSYYDFCFSGEV